MDTGKKHPLLAYRIRYRRHLRPVSSSPRWRCWRCMRRSSCCPPRRGPTCRGCTRLDWLLLLVGIVVLVIAVLRFIAARVPYVQCSERNIKIQAPLYQVVFSYKRVHETRPNTLFHVFEKGGLSRGERKFVLDDKYRRADGRDCGDEQLAHVACAGCASGWATWSSPRTTGRWCCGWRTGWRSIARSAITRIAGASARSRRETAASPPICIAKS